MVIELEDLFQKNGYSEKDFRLDMAILVYQRKVASLARAAKLAGVSKQSFETVLEERGIPHKEVKSLTAAERLLATLSADDPLRAVIKPMRKHVTAEQLMKEQNYTGTNWDRVHKLVDDLAIEEPIELLLAQLKE